jgi:thiol:disulfide interchange protein DsbG
MKIIHTVWIAVVCIVLSALVTIDLIHKAPAKPNVTQAEALLSKISQGNVTILQNFTVNPSIQGFVVTTKPVSDKRGLLYTDSQGQYLVDGNLVDINGNSLAQQDYYKYVQPKAAVNAYKTIAQTAWIQQGSDTATHKLYAVIDPNCIFCHQAFLALEPKIQSGQIAIRWVVVGIIKPDSKAKALAILNAQDPLGALLQNEHNFNEQTEEGGIAPLALTAPMTTTKLDTNMQFATQNQLMQTPTFFYKDTAGNMQIQAGMPQGPALDKLINSVGNQF